MPAIVPVLEVLPLVGLNTAAVLTQRMRLYVHSLCRFTQHAILGDMRQAFNVQRRRIGSCARCLLCSMLVSGPYIPAMNAIYRVQNSFICMLCFGLGTLAKVCKQLDSALEELCL